MNTLDLVRGLVRPLVTLVLVLTVSLLVLRGVEIPDWYQRMTELVVGFWFLQRMMGKANGTK